MASFIENGKLKEHLKKALEWYSQNEDSSRMEILVDKDFFDKAEEMARVLNTDVEGIFTFAAYRLIKKGDLPSRAWVGRKSARQIYGLH